MVGVASPKRMPAAPDVPTFTEQGIAGMDLTSWIAIVGPARMPADLVAKLNAMLVQALNSPDVKEFYAKGAWETSPSTPAELSTEMRVAYDRWGAMVKHIGFASILLSMLLHTCTTLSFLHHLIIRIHFG